MPKELSDSIGQYQFNFAVDDNSALDHICDDLVMARAYKILEERHLHSQGKFLESPDDVKALFQMRHSGLKYETFDVAFLTNRHSLIAVKSLFRGDIASCSVHPRQVLLECINHNAAAVVLSHGHPANQSCEPSRADLAITRKLKEVLATCEIRTLDHIITIDGNAISLAERGEM